MCVGEVAGAYQLAAEVFLPHGGLDLPVGAGDRSVHEPEIGIDLQRPEFDPVSSLEQPSSYPPPRWWRKRI